MSGGGNYRLDFSAGGFTIMRCLTHI